jgi:hypothetical protein
VTTIESPICAERLLRRVAVSGALAIRGGRLEPGLEAAEIAEAETRHGSPKWVPDPTTF